MASPPSQRLPNPMSLHLHLHIPLTLLTALLAHLPLAKGFSWTFQNTPQQCANLTLNIVGSDGTPPYEVLIIPFGPSPLQGNVEARKILQVPFGDRATSVSFKLSYPENSQFVAVVSDSKNFGSGGTSVAAQVTSSNDASCFDSSKSVTPDFVFSIDPPNQLVQCQDTRLSWDPSTVQGTPNFVGVIPGGQSFAVPQGQITTVQSEGTGFSWTPSVRAGTTLILVGGDNRGNGTGGSFFNVVSAGINNNGSCLSNSSPSSTPGSPAGGSYPTGTGSNSGSSTGSKHSNTGAIVGGVVGGIAAFIIFLILLWYCRRQRKQKRIMKERPDLLNDDEDEGAGVGAQGTRRNELPQYYQPEPFMVPDPTAEGSTTGTATGTGTGTDDPEGSRRPMSATNTSFYTRATTPDQASGSASAYGYTGRKGAPRPMRAVNIVQHEDAGPSVPPPEADKAGEEEPETIELPPAYTAVGRSAASVGAGGESGGGGAATVPNEHASPVRAGGGGVTGPAPPSPPHQEAAA